MSKMKNFMLENEIGTYEVPTWSCSWVVNKPSNNPEPDFPEDCWTLAECGATAIIVGEGWECENGHKYAGIEAELGPGGLEWEREQNERYGY